MSLRPKISLFWLLATLLVSLSSHAGEPGQSMKVPLEDQPQDLVEHIVWDQARPLVPRFLPASLLQREGIENLPIDIDTVAGLEEDLRFLEERRKEGKSPVCQWSSENGFTVRETPNGRTMTELFAPQGIVVYGRVRAVIPGWALNQAMTMVYVEVEEILHCGAHSARTISIGDVVAGTLEMGSFELDNLTVCTRTPEGFVVPEVGDMVVIGGSPDPIDPYFIGLWTPVFPVQDGVILPQPYSNLRWDSVPLEKLKEELNGPQPVCLGRR